MKTGNNTTKDDNDTDSTLHANPEPKQPPASKPKKIYTAMVGEGSIGGSSIQPSSPNLVKLVLLIFFIILPIIGSYLIFNYVNGKQDLVTDFVKNNSNIYESADKVTSKQNPTSSSGCLVLEDYRWMNYGNEPDKYDYDSEFNPPKSFNKTVYVFFQPNSIIETYDGRYDNLADFASKNSNKEWKFRLSGSINKTKVESNAVSEHLANERANKVKKELESRGVPNDRIIIDAPQYYGSSTTGGTDDNIFNDVVIVVDPTCTATSEED